MTSKTPPCCSSSSDTPPLNIAPTIVDLTIDDDDASATSSSDLKKEGTKKLSPIFDPNNDNSSTTPLEHEIGSEKEEAEDTPKEPPAIRYTYKTSAYLLHLSEICHTMLHDARWDGLWKWEFGDDLSAAVALARYHESEEDREEKVDSVSSEDEGDDDDSSCLGRAMYLYSRLFVRRGSWFRLDDIWDRYYLSNDYDIGLLWKDVGRLLSMGLLRSFSDEEECTILCGNSRQHHGGILKEDERTWLCKKLGLTRSKKSVNELWHRRSSQSSLFAASFTTNKTEKHLFPVRRHVHHLLYQKIMTRLTENDKQSNNCDTNETLPPMCIRLREKPLLTLRRMARLFIIATNGPGHMRSTGWVSALEPLVAPQTGSKSDPQKYDDFARLQYPGLAHRFQLKTCSFVTDHKTLPKKQKGASRGVFRNNHEFHKWEVTVEIRARVDYLFERNEMLRKQMRQTHHKRPQARNKMENDDTVCDSWQIVSSRGRLRLLNLFFSAKNEENGGDASSLVSLIHRQIEVLIGQHPFPEDDTAHTQAERCIFMYTILSMQLLRQHSTKSFSSSSAAAAYRIEKRPWQRHFHWESVLACICWDGVALLEKKKLFVLAVPLLELLLLQPQPTKPINNHKSNDIDTVSKLVWFSRRSRGKAFERLVIDHTHLCRQTKTSKAEKDAFLPERILRSTAATDGSVPFQTLRNFVKRQKRQPASSSSTRNDKNDIDDFFLECNTERMELNMTLSHANSEWVPPTDHSIAHAVSSVDETKNGVGSRCRYVGWEEEDENNTIAHRSLNVEELALEEYYSGRLPSSTISDDDKDVATSGGGTKGGWVGWHDEGGHIRALFRILCRRSLLHFSSDEDTEGEEDTIFCTPYQSAPHDLHVGHLYYSEEGRADASATATALRGFYERRKSTIESFLDHLESLTPQGLCDLVFSCVEREFNERSLGGEGRDKTLSNPKDVVLRRDVGEVRTLSALAAGMGGLGLSRIFRCFCFDYRHWSGGLPDLLLVRALYLDDVEGQEKEIVDLSKWIGEGFESGGIHKSGRGLVQGFFDREDEFLGCDKSGDSLDWRKNGAANSAPKNDDTVKDENDTSEPDLELAEKLLLTNDGRPVKIECMFVEVKSSNDRLDGRQEDWLNVLHGVGLARVCKFGTNKSKR